MDARSKEILSLFHTVSNYMQDVFSAVPSQVRGGARFVAAISKSSHGRSKYCSKGAGENEHMLCAFLLAQSREQSSCTDRVHKLCTQPLPRRAPYHADYMNWRLTCPTPMADAMPRAPEIQV